MDKPLTQVPIHLTDIAPGVVLLEVNRDEPGGFSILMVLHVQRPAP